MTVKEMHGLVAHFAFIAIPRLAMCDPGFGATNNFSLLDHIATNSFKNCITNLINSKGVFIHRYAR